MKVWVVITTQDNQFRSNTQHQMPLNDIGVGLMCRTVLNLATLFIVKVTKDVLAP